MLPKRGKFVSLTLAVLLLTLILVTSSAFSYNQPENTLLNTKPSALLSDDLDLNFSVPIADNSVPSTGETDGNKFDLASTALFLQSRLESITNGKTWSIGPEANIQVSFSDLKDCEGELQCWLNRLTFSLPTLPFNISGIVGNMTDFKCSHINVDRLSSGLNPPPYPAPDDTSEFHMGVKNAGLQCTGTFYYNMTFWPYIADFATFTATVDETNLGLQVYIQSDGFAASGTRQGDCSISTRIGLNFEGSVSALILELVKQPLIDMITGLVQDNFCIVTRDLINITMTEMIQNVNEMLKPILVPHKPLPPVSKEAAAKSIPFADLQIFQFLDHFLNGDEHGAGILSNPDPLNCIVGLFTDHTGTIDIPTFDPTDPNAFMPNITIPIPDLGSITIGLPSVQIQNLNTIESFTFLHTPPDDETNDSFTFNNGLELSRLKIFLKLAMIIDLKETISPTPLHENFLFMVDMTKPTMGLDIRSVVDTARLRLAKLGGFCAHDGLIPCLMSLFQGTWSGNGGLQLAAFGLNAKFSMGIQPLSPNDSPLEKDLDLLLNNLVMSLAEKFSPMFTRIIFGLADNLARGIINEVLVGLGEHATAQCDAVTPQWDGKSNTPLLWDRSIIRKFIKFVLHDLLSGVNGVNDLISCAWHGGSVGPDHDFDTIVIPDQDGVVRAWWEHWQAFSETYNITTAPLFETFNKTMRGLSSFSKLEFFKPLVNNETHHDNHYRLFGEIGIGKSSATPPQPQTCPVPEGLHDWDSRSRSKPIPMLDISPQHRGIYFDYVSNMTHSHQQLTGYSRKVDHFKKLIGDGINAVHANARDGDDDDDDDEVLRLIRSGGETVPSNKTAREVLTELLSANENNHININDNDNNNNNNIPSIRSNDLINNYLKMLTHLSSQTTPPLTSVTSIPTEQFSSENGQQQQQQLPTLRWGIANDNNERHHGDGDGDGDGLAEPIEPTGPLRIWLALGVPISRRYILVNTTVVIDSFEVDGTAFFQVNKDRLYDLTIAKTFSLCLPSVINSFHFEAFSGHVKALTLVLDVLMDPRAKLFHQHRTGQEFVDQVNRAFAEDALPLLADLTTGAFETLVWASTYACQGKPIPGAPKIVENLKHSIVEWLAIAIPGGTIIFFLLYSFVLLTTKEGTQNWNKFFCRSGRGSSKGHVVLSSTDINQQAHAAESSFTNNSNPGSNSSFTIRAQTTHGSILESTVTPKSSNNTSLSLSVDDKDFIEDYHPITLPVQPAYGILNLGSLNDGTQFDHAEELGAYIPPSMIKSQNDTTTPATATVTTTTTKNKNKNNNKNKDKNPTHTHTSSSFPETSSISKPHTQNPGLFAEPTGHGALINLNTLSLESGLSIDSLTGSSLLHSPTLPLLLRAGMVVALLTNILIFLVSNMSNGAAVTVIIRLFQVDYDFGTIFNFTLISTIEDMWKARVYVLFVLIGAFSGFLPYFKIVLMLVAWCLPTHKLSVQWREFILVWLDRLGKFSLLDAFVFCLMFVAFRMHLPLIGDNLIVDSIVRPDPGFYFFLLATMMSMGLSHISLALHRHALTPYAVESGGPTRSLLQHYHTIFVIDQASPHYSLQQHALLNSLPECQEYQELLQDRNNRKRQEDEKYRKNLEKLGYNSIVVTSLDPYNSGLNSDTGLVTSESNASMFDTGDLNDIKSNPSSPHTTTTATTAITTTTTAVPISGNKTYAVKIRISFLGACLLVTALFATLIILMVGTFGDTFSFKFGGISGWLLGEDFSTNDWSIWTVGTDITLSSRDPSAIGIHWIQVTYFAFAILMPVGFILFMVFLLVYPLTLQTTKAIHVLVEIFFAWSGVDVFIISILAAVLQIAQLAESLVGDRCDFLLPFLRDYMHDALDGHPKCFVVLAAYKAGAVYLVLAAVFILALGVATIALSSSALADRMNKYFRLIQYSLYQKQLKEGTSESRLIPFQSHSSTITNNLISSGPTGVGIVSGNNKNTSIVDTVQSIIRAQHVHNAPVERIPSWFGLINMLSRIHLVHLSRSDVIEDVFGWSKGGNPDKIHWDQVSIASSLSQSTLSAEPEPVATTLVAATSPTKQLSSTQKSKSNKTKIAIQSDPDFDHNEFSVDYSSSITTTPAIQRELSFSTMEPV